MKNSLANFTRHWSELKSEAAQLDSWLFGDFGRPLLGVQAGRLVADSSLIFRTQIANVLTRGHKAPSSKLSKEATIEHHRTNLNQLLDLLESERQATNLALDQRGLSVGNVGRHSGVELGSLPWSKGSWGTLSALGLMDSDPVLALDAFSWGEVLVAGDWRSILEILHMVHDWAPYAIDENLLVPPGYDLHELADFVERLLIARMGAKSDDNFNGFGILRERNAWGVERKTLDEIGNLRSLTRERIRQIEKKIEIQNYGQQLKPFAAIEKLLNLEYDPTFINPVETIEETFDQTGNWDLPGIEKLIELSSGSEELHEFRKLISAASISSEGLSGINRAIVKTRSVIGVIRLQDLQLQAKSAGIDDSELRSLITKRYPKSIFAGQFVAARQIANECMLFNYVHSQLLVNQPLHVDVLHAGIERAAKARNAMKWVPPLANLREMLEKHESFEVSSTGFVSADIESDVDETISGWLVRELRTKSGFMSAKSTLLRAGALEGYKFSTLTQYLQYGPEFRSLNNGLVCLVGSKVNEQDRQHALAIAEVNDVKNRVISYEIEDESSFTAKLIFSTNFMVSGVLSVNPDLAILLGSKVRKSLCCSAFVSDAYPKLSSSSLWANLSSLRDHLWMVHGYREGDVIEFRVTRESVQPQVST